MIYFSCHHGTPMTRQQLRCRIGALQPKEASKATENYMYKLMTKPTYHVREKGLVLWNAAELEVWSWERDFTLMRTEIDSVIPSTDMIQKIRHGTDATIYCDLLLSNLDITRCTEGPTVCRMKIKLVPKHWKLYIIVSRDGQRHTIIFLYVRVKCVHKIKGVLCRLNALIGKAASIWLQLDKLQCFWMRRVLNAL